MCNKGLISVERGRLVLTCPLEEVYPGIPETLQQMLEIQLEQLSPEDLRILQSACIAGERFSVWSVEAMLDVSSILIEETCDRLTKRAQFIRSVGVQAAPNGIPSAHYEFRHSLYRQALYHSLSALSRSELHRGLCTRLMPICDARRPVLAPALALNSGTRPDYGRA